MWRELASGFAYWHNTAPTSFSAAKISKRYNLRSATFRFVEVSKIFRTMLLTSTTWSILQCLNKPSRPEPFWKPLPQPVKTAAADQGRKDALQHLQLIYERPLKKGHVN